MTSGPFAYLKPPATVEEFIHVPPSLMMVASLTLLNLFFFVFLLTSCPGC